MPDTEIVDFVFDFGDMEPVTIKIEPPLGPDK